MATTTSTGTRAKATAPRKPRAKASTPSHRKSSATKAAAAVKDATTSAVDTAQTAAGKALAATHAPEAAKAVATRARSVKSAAKKVVKPAPQRRTASRSPVAHSRAAGAGKVIGAAAAGLVAGIAANFGRKAAVQAPSVMAGDWFEALKTEHKAALALLDKLARSTPKQPAKRSMLLTQLKHALGKHAFTEENAVYPALREWGDKADADALSHEQAYHKQFLYELDKMDKAAPGFAQKVADFRADLESHIREEEDKIFPKLHKGLNTDQNKALTAAANKEGFKLA